MECQKVKNQSFCNCTYPCNKHGICCQCLEYHRNSGELPACYFPADAERTYDRSIENYLRIQSKK